MVKPSERLGNFEVATSPDGSALVLGSGAGGVTYRGRHVHLGTEVAIKVLVRRRHLLKKDRDAFLSEARAAASLSHPQIARILDFGESAQQHPYYVMELCEGGSLEDLGRRSGPPDDYAFTQWLFEAASALAHAHQRGILHRDIKPSNLLVAIQNSTATIKLIDFGLAHQADPDETSDGVIGTPLFAAPEQLRGKAEAASDVFSLGACFLWLLTGRLLSKGDVWKVIDDRLTSTGYASSLQDLPEIWQNLLGRMLEVDPARRLRHGGDVLTALQETFPHHAGHPVVWENSTDDPSSSSPAALPSHWIDHPATDWPVIWTATTPPSTIEHGVSFQATRSDTGEVHDVSLFNKLSTELIAILTTQGDLLACHSSQLGLDRLVLDRGDNWWTVAWPSPGSDDALSWVRKGQTASTAELLTALDPIAAALDAMTAGGFEALEIHPSMLTVSGGTAESPLKFSLAVQLPVLGPEHHPSESSATMRGAVGAGLCARFAACIYQLLSGRTVPPAAFVNARAYQAIPKLTERANRFLSSAISGNLTGGSCQDVISGVAHEERLPGSTFSGSGTIRSRTGSTWAARPPTGPPTATASSIPSPPPPVLQVAAPPPLPTPALAASPPPVSRPSPSLRKLIPAALAVLVVALLGGTSWWFLSRPTPGKSPSPAPAPAESEARISPPTTIPPESLELVKVPGDADTLQAAIALCKTGGTIEIDGGTYSESINITRSLSLVSKKAAIIESNASETSLIFIRGPIQVTLRNIQIRNSLRDAVRGIDTSPPLVLMSDGSNATLEGCFIESSLGNGISLVDGASARFSNCRIRNNRGTGVNADGGSKIEINLSEIQQNGRNGITAGGSGTALTLGSGSTISTNSQFGIEIGSGATLTASGTEISGNKKAGIIVLGGGSTARMDSASRLVRNEKYGAAVTRDGSLHLSDADIEENSEAGIIVESGGRLEVLSSRFRANGEYGVHLMNGTTSEVTISKSEFNSHTTAAAIFFEGSGTITASRIRFPKSACAILYGTASRGTATDNAISPGPLADAIVTQEGIGGVTLKDNSLAPTE
jgi:serine/threonine protein kinase